MAEVMDVGASQVWRALSMHTKLVLCKGEPFWLFTRPSHLLDEMHATHSTKQVVYGHPTEY